MACCASLNGNLTKLWGINQNEIDDVNKGFNKRVFGEKRLFAPLFATNDFSQVVCKANVVIIAVPSIFIEEVLRKTFAFFVKNPPSNRNFCLDIVNVAKGFDPKTNTVWSKTISKYLKKCSFKGNLVSIIGPSFAVDVINQCPTAVNAVSSSKLAAKRISRLLSTNFFVIKTISDEMGAQVLSALKNFLAIGVGILDSAFKSANTNAMILTLGIGEMRRLCSVFGFSERTLFELCGIGDVFLTCSSKKSRNFSFGQRLYELNSVSKAREQSVTIEGYHVAKIVEKLISKNHLKLPIFRLLTNVLNEKIKPKDFVKEFVKVVKS